MRAQAGAVTWSVFALRNTVLTGAGIQALAPLRVQHAKLVAMHHLDRHLAPLAPVAAMRAQDHHTAGAVLLVGMRMALGRLALTAFLDGLLVPRRLQVVISVRLASLQVHTLQPSASSAHADDLSVIQVL